MCMPVRTRRLSQEEGQYLLQVVGRGRPASVRLRWALVKPSTNVRARRRADPSGSTSTATEQGLRCGSRPPHDHDQPTSPLMITRWLFALPPHDREVRAAVLGGDRKSV